VAAGIRPAVVTSAVCALVLLGKACTNDFDALFGSASPDGGGTSGTGGVAGSGGSGANGGGGGSAGSGASGASGGSGGLSDAPSDADDAGQGYPEVVLSDGPIAYFRLGESPVGDAGSVSAKDEVGNFVGHYEGQVDLAVAGAIAGDSNTAAHFAGTGVLMRVDDVGTQLDFDGTKPFTAEAWVKQDPSPPPQANGVNHFHFISKYDSSLSLANQVGYSLYLNNQLDGSPAHFTFVRKNGTPDAGVIESIAGGTSIDPAVWHYVAAVFDGSTIRIHVDDEPAKSGSSPFSIGDTSIPLSVGNSASGGASFRGAIDEVAIYAKALSVERIAAHYSMGKNGK
jgi:Concanavalin A-like lectin/glucanases superfamily